MKNNMNNIDFNQKYGLNLKEIFKYPNKEQLSFLINDICKRYKDKDKILIYDWGGGNGLLALSLLDILSKYDNLHFLIIDIDDSKFINHPKIKNVKADISDVNLACECDYSIVRNTFHYNNQEINLKILKNIKSLTKNNLLYINMYSVPKEEKYFKRFSTFLMQWFNVYRNYPLFKILKESLELSGWKIESEKKIINKNFDFINFSRKRYGLDIKKLNKLKEEKIDMIKTNGTAIFWCKKKTKCSK